RFAFGTDNLCLRQAFGADDFGLRQAARAVCVGFAHTTSFSSICLALRFQDESLAFGFGGGLDAPAIRFGAFLDGRLQFEFAALDFGLLHFDLGLLLDLGHFDRFGNDL